MLLLTYTANTAITESNTVYWSSFRRTLGRRTRYEFSMSLRHDGEVVIRNFGTEIEDERKDWVRIVRETSESMEAAPQAENAKFVDKNEDDFQWLLKHSASEKVKIYKDKKTDETIAMKILDKKSINTDISHVLTENNILQMTNHPFLVSFRSSFHTESSCCYIMEYVDGKDLSTYLDASDGHKFPESQSCFYGAEIIMAIQFLHELGFIYGDLKLENLLLDADGHIRLKLCKEGVTFTTKNFHRAPEYMAPEVLECGSFNGYAVDWWGLGVVMYRMMCGQLPFCGSTPADIYAMILEGIEFPAAAHLSENAADLLFYLLQQNPAQRLGGKTEKADAEKGAEEVKKHAFFQHINWQDLYDKKLPVPSEPKVAMKQ